MKTVVFILILVSCTAFAQRGITGKITYLASGSVYLSIGRDQGIEDSSRVIVLRSRDTLALLQVFAVSSKSSVCRVQELRKEIRIGDSVNAMVTVPQEIISIPSMKFDSSAIAQLDSLSVRPHINSTPLEKKPLNLRGRIGVQYYAMLFDDGSMNMQQPGMIVSLRGDMTDVPVKFDMYGTFRMTGRNGSAPLSSAATNDSRMYRFSFEYDNQSVIIGAGRILPIYASSVGYVDGVSIAKRMGKVVSGVSIGFQPDASLQLPTTDTKKFLVFTQYQPNDSWNTTATASYARIWSSQGIEREAFSSYVSLYSPNGFSLYASGDIDLRTLSNSENQFSPALSLLVCSATYRFSEVVTAGVTIDASRPVYSLSSNKTIPDSLLDKQLHSGISFNANVSLWRGAGVYNVYTIRLGNDSPVKEYSNSSSLYYNNIVRTGANVRLNYVVNESSFNLMHGFGVTLQRNIVGVDFGLRYQQNRSVISQIQLTSTTTTVGADVSAFLTNQLTLMGSFDLMQGLGMTTRSFYLELSRRF